MASSLMTAFKGDTVDTGYSPLTYARLLTEHYGGGQEGSDIAMNLLKGITPAGGAGGAASPGAAGAAPASGVPPAANPLGTLPGLPGAPTAPPHPLATALTNGLTGAQSPDIQQLLNEGPLGAGVAAKIQNGLGAGGIGPPAGSLQAQQQTAANVMAGTA
jgi:hypothetical protein